VSTAGHHSDVENIRDLIHAYCYFLDQGQHERWVDLYADDGVLDAGPMGIHRGRIALMEFSRTLPARPCWRHGSSNIRVRINGSRARATSYVCVLDAVAPVPTIIYTGCYLDDFVKLDGLWRYAARSAVAGPADLPDLGEYL
jgi:hypothetical protein